MARVKKKGGHLAQFQIQKHGSKERPKKELAKLPMDSDGEEFSDEDLRPKKKTGGSKQGFTDENRKWLKAKQNDDDDSEENDDDEDIDEYEDGDGGDGDSDISLEAGSLSDESNDDDDGELEVEKKSRLLDEEKIREAEEAKDEGMQLNIQGDSDDFRLPTAEVCSASALKAGVEDWPLR
jgi:ribosomal RNA methyltransferase Nop2